MYSFKDKEVFRKYNKTQSARIIGIDPATLNRIVSGKQQCSKLVAYAITKFLNTDAEIEEYFTYKKGE